MKIKLFFILTTLFFTNLSSSECEWVIDLRGDYFYPTSKKFRKIYNEGWGEEIQIAKVFQEKWITWGNIGYFQKKGHSIGLRERTKIEMVPTSVGLNYQFFPCCQISPYLGLGASYTFLHVENNSDFVKEHVTKGGFGFVVKSGAYINLSEHILLDLFADYYYANMHFYEKNYEDVGGFKLGLGLGYRF